MWDAIDLSSSADKLEVTWPSFSYTTFDLVGSDKLSDKCSKLALGGSVQLSILSGLARVSGPCSYLKSSGVFGTGESCVHICCYHRTASKSLTQQLNNAKPLNGSLPLVATHIVSQIQYGADATFTLSGKTRFPRQLDVLSDKLVDVLSSPSDDFDDDRDCIFDVIDCKFDANFHLPKGVCAPTTYREALDFAKSFARYLKEGIDKDVDGRPLGVPCQVWFYPLVLLDGGEKAPVLYYHVTDDDDATDFLQLMERYDDMTAQANDLLADPMTDTLIPFKPKITRFLTQLCLYRPKLVRQLREKIVDIRSARFNTDDDDGGDLLYSLYEDVVNSPFNPDRLQRWLDDKQHELLIMKKFVSKFWTAHKQRLIQFPSKEELMDQVNNYAQCYHLIFTSLANLEPLLEAMEATDEIEFVKEVSSLSSVEDIWCRQPSIVEFVVRLTK